MAFSPTALFSKIKGNPEFDPETAPGARGDVISHLSGTREIQYGENKIKVEVLQNPSHLEVCLTALTDRQPILTLCCRRSTR